MLNMKRATPSRRRLQRLKTQLLYLRNELVFVIGIGKCTNIRTVIVPIIQAKTSNFVAHIATRTYREFGCLVEIFIDEHTSHGHRENALGNRSARLPAGLLSADAKQRLDEKTRNNSSSDVVTWQW